MKMVRGAFFFGLGAAAGAAYFFDGRKGDKRRRRVRKQLQQAAHASSGIIQDCTRQARNVASNFVKNGTSEWIPSPRLAGSLGSMLAVYSAGRRGPAGAILRILSLGLFVRALMPADNGNSNIKERPHRQKVFRSSPAHAESLV